MRGRAWLLAAMLSACVAGQDPDPNPDGPAFDPATARTAKSAEDAGDLDRAIELYTTLGEKDPKNPKWALGAARCLRRAGRFNDAVRALVNAEFRIPDDPDLPAARATTYHLKAESQLREGVRSELAFLYGEAATVTRTILERFPDHRQARLTLAMSLYQTGDIEGARAQAEQAIERFPEHPGGHLVIGKIAYYNFVTLDAQRREAKPRSKEWARLAQDAAKAGGVAMRAYQRALELDPNRADAHVQVGNIYGQRDNREQALVAFGKALAVNPLAAVNHGWVAQVATPQRRAEFYAQALEAHASATPATIAGLVWWRARAEFDRGDYTAAFPLFVTAAETERYANARFYATLCAFRAENREDAETQAATYAGQSPAKFAGFVETQPNKDEIVKILQALADQSFTNKRLARSRDLNRVLALVTGTVDHWNNFAFLARETKKFAWSLEGYERALELEPDSPRLLNDAAVILQYHLPGEGNRERARQMYLRAVKLADAILLDKGASDEQRKVATSAKSDARGNLARLK